MNNKINSDTKNEAMELRIEIEAALKKLEKYTDKFEELEHVSGHRKRTAVNLYFTAKFMIKQYREITEDRKGFDLYIGRLYYEGSRLSPYDIEV